MNEKQKCLNCGKILLWKSNVGLCSDCVGEMKKGKIKKPKRNEMEDYIY